MEKGKKKKTKLHLLDPEKKKGKKKKKTSKMVKRGKEDKEKLEKKTGKIKKGGENLENLIIENYNLVPKFSVLNCQYSKFQC